MAKIISVAMQKGGVGKTTSSFNMGAALADKGYKVLLVDNDEQASLTESAALDPYEIKPSISDVYLGNAQIEDAIYLVGIDNLAVLPADIYLSTVPAKLQPTQASYLTLRHALVRIEDQFDFIIIDNPPSLAFCVINALFAADYVVIPCTPSIKDRRALPLIYDSITEARRHNKKLKNLGVLVTKMRKRVKDHEVGYEEIKKEYDVIGTIMYSTDAEKENEGLPVVMFKKSSTVAKQYADAVDNILTLIEEETGEQNDEV